MIGSSPYPITSKWKPRQIMLFLCIIIWWYQKFIYLCREQKQRAMKYSHNLLNNITEFNKTAAKRHITPDEVSEYIDFLKKNKASVFVFHMEDGTSRLNSDELRDRKSMELFFIKYPQTGCKSVEFLK